MRFFEVVLSGAALISTVWAVTIDQYPSALVAGETVTLTYSPKDAPATFVLRKGLSTNLDTIATIGTATGGSFEWTVPTDLVDGPDYAFEVKQGDENNYSAQIPLTGGSGSSSSASSSAGYPTMTPSSSVIASSAASSSAYSTETIVIPSSSVILTTSAALPVASASGTGYPTMPGMNSTITTATLSTSGSSPSSTDSSPPAEQTGAATMFGSSPLALLVGAAAMAYLN